MLVYSNTVDLCQHSGWNCQPWPSRSQNWMFVYFIIILSHSQQFPTSSSQNQVELGEWATGHFMHCQHSFNDLGYEASRDISGNFWQVNDTTPWCIKYPDAHLNGVSLNVKIYFDYHLDQWQFHGPLFISRSTEYTFNMNHIMYQMINIWAWDPTTHKKPLFALFSILFCRWRKHAFESASADSCQQHSLPNRKTNTIPSNNSTSKIKTARPFLKMRWYAIRGINYVDCGGVVSYISIPPNAPPVHGFGWQLRGIFGWDGHSPQMGWPVPRDRRTGCCQNPTWLENCGLDTPPSRVSVSYCPQNPVKSDKFVTQTRKWLPLWSCDACVPILPGEVLKSGTIRNDPEQWSQIRSTWTLKLNISAVTI